MTILLKDSLGPTLNGADAPVGLARLAEAAAAADRDGVPLVLDFADITHIRARWVREALAPLLRRPARDDTQPVVLIVDDHDLLEDLSVAIAAAASTVVALTPSGARILGGKSSLNARAADVVEHGPTTVLELADRRGLSQQGADVFLRLLWRLGIVERTLDRANHNRFRYRPTLVGERLREAHGAALVA